MVWVSEHMLLYRKLYFCPNLGHFGQKGSAALLQFTLYLYLHHTLFCRNVAKMYAFFGYIYFVNLEYLEKLKHFPVYRKGHSLLY